MFKFFRYAVSKIEVPNGVVFIEYKIIKSCKIPKSGKEIFKGLLSYYEKAKPFIEAYTPAYSTQLTKISFRSLKTPSLLLP